MAYRIKTIDLFVRNISPPRMDFAIGKGHSLFPAWMRINVEVRLMIESDDGRTAFGCSADWPSFGWLDKRAELEPRQKFADLLRLIQTARKVFLSNSRFETAFECWWRTQSDFLQIDSVKNSVPLCASFSLALIERALLDAVCRIDNVPFHEGLLKKRLGFQPELIHDELQEFDWLSCFPKTPLNQVHIRHTVGPHDPLLKCDLEDCQTLDDGLPQTLEDYVKCDGISFFKIKICGDRQRDLERLRQIWNVIESSNPTITLDGNEAYDNVSEFRDFVRDLSRQQKELFSRILFIEQPTSRSMTYDMKHQPIIDEISRFTPLIIDEADGYLHAFFDATKLGYQGTSHKNCKGVFKSLANHVLCQFRNRSGQQLFLSAEDLTSLPMVAVQQDFAVVGAIGLQNAERNGHHFFAGLSHLSDSERQAALTWHADLYVQRGENMQLKIVNGLVDITSLNASSGMGVQTEPDWSVMVPLESWLSDFQLHE